MVLSYCSAVSFVTICHLLLKLALDVSFHWNPLIFDDPLPFHFSFASAFFLGVQGKLEIQDISFFDELKNFYLGVWNLHTFSLLIMLSRGPRDFQDYVKTVSKFIENSAGSIDQVDKDKHLVIISSSIQLFLLVTKSMMISIPTQFHFQSEGEIQVYRGKLNKIIVKHRIRIQR